MSRMPRMRRLFTLLGIELKLAFRSPDMVLFAILMPVIVLVTVGLVFGPGPDDGPGMIDVTIGAFLAIGVCAVGLMGLPLGLAEYRSRKVLKRLRVTPVHPGLLLSVQMIAQSIVSIVSALVVAATAIVGFGVRLDGAPFLIAGAYLLVMVSIFSIGLVIASTARDVKRAGIIASIVYFPMLLFSGTTVPFPVFPEAVQRAAAILPLRHGIELLNAAALGSPVVDLLPRAALLAAIAIVGIIVSVQTFRWDME